MPFSWDDMPYTNFHELNIDWFINKFKEIFEEWRSLYNQLTTWKDATDAELEAWKTAQESQIAGWEAATITALDVWKGVTETSIESWETATLAALDAWKTAAETAFEAIRVQAAASATAAAGSATDAETAKTAAIAAQTAAETAAASVTASAAQIATNTDNIADLENALLTNYTSKYDMEKMQPDNIRGFVSQGNMSHLVGTLASGQYINTTASDEHLVLADSVPYTTYIFGVNEDIASVTFGGFNGSVTLRIAFLASDKYTYVKAPVLNTGTGRFTVETGGAKYIAYSTTSFVGVSAGTEYIADASFNSPMWVRKAFNKYDQYMRAEIGTKGLAELPVIINGIKKKMYAVYETIFESPFAHICVGYKTSGGDYTTNYTFMFDIMASTIAVKIKGKTDVTLTHGISMANYARIKIEIDYGGTIDFELYSNGQTYENHELTFNYDRIYPFIHTQYNPDTTLTGITWTCRDFNKKYWLFGDSYISDEDTRWMHYYEYKDNLLLNGYPGENSYYAYNDLLNIIKFGKPKYIIWTLGMNDGSDTDENTPNAQWAGYRDLFLALCEKEAIVPIFATIPTVPTINNNGKNKWIRESGYRYIDFARAVGADSDGNWYAGHIAPDGIHPSSLGAIALCSQAYFDLPDASID